jgi:hypothetical protein
MNLHMHHIKNYIDNRYSYYNKIELPYLDFELGTAVDVMIKNYYMKKNYPTVLKKKTNQAIMLGMVDCYIQKYDDEYFHSFKTPVWSIPIKKHTIWCSPDLTAKMYNSDQRAIIELKTGPVGETLDFQTMCYAWASYRWDFAVPIVIKRTIQRPRIKLKKGEKEKDFIKRLVLYEYKIKVGVAVVTKHMILEFEKYLICILKEMQSRNKYKFYRRTS